MKSLNSETNQAAGNVCLFFTASWCGNCKMIHPMMEKTASTLSNVTMYEVDVEKRKDVAEKYSIKSLPSVVCLKDGEVLTTLYGVGNLSNKKIAEVYAP